MDPHKPHDTPGHAHPIQGQVVLLGPDGAAVAMTPEAAEATAEALKAAAVTARTQSTEPEDPLA